MDGCGLNAYSMSQEEIDNAHFNYRERFRLLSAVSTADAIDTMICAINLMVSFLVIIQMF